MIHLTLLPGDGVGPELMAQVRVVLKALQSRMGLEIQHTEQPVGRAALESVGETVPEATLRTVRETGCALLGGLDVAACPPPSPMGRLRRELGLYAEVRPIRSLYPADRSGGRADFAVIRDLSEGFLADRNMWRGIAEFMPTPDVALSVRVITRAATERIARFALEYMNAHGRRHVTLVHKAGVFTVTGGLFRDVAREVLEPAAGISISEEAVDQAAGRIVAEPETFDILLTTNLYGDILSDVGAALVGGLVPAAGFGRGVSLYRPGHEALPELAGTGRINPIPMFLALEMVLRGAGRVKAAEAVILAVRKTVTDLSLDHIRLENLNTAEVTGEFCRRLA